jgi:hypothetical protein
MGEGSGLDVIAGWRPWRVSDRVIVPLKLGNAGGGKDPDFWCSFEAAKLDFGRFRTACNR